MESWCDGMEVREEIPDQCMYMCTVVQLYTSVYYRGTTGNKCYCLSICVPTSTHSACIMGSQCCTAVLPNLDSYIIQTFVIIQDHGCENTYVGFYKGFIEEKDLD